MKSNEWKNDAKCLDYDTDLFFDKYEENEGLRLSIDSLCLECPAIRQCFAVGVSQKEWGVWGGIYLESGTISKEFNSHKNKDEWSNTWKTLMMESE